MNRPILRLPVVHDDALRTEVLALWKHGFDTYDISRMTGQHEAVVYTALRMAREQAA